MDERYLLCQHLVDPLLGQNRDSSLKPPAGSFVTWLPTGGEDSACAEQADSKRIHYLSMSFYSAGRCVQHHESCRGTARAACAPATGMESRRT